MRYELYNRQTGKVYARFNRYVDAFNYRADHNLAAASIREL
jgi:hypothetical protein